MNVEQSRLMPIILVMLALLSIGEAYLLYTHFGGYSFVQKSVADEVQYDKIPAAGSGLITMSGTVSSAGNNTLGVRTPSGEVVVRVVSNTRVVAIVGHKDASQIESELGAYNATLKELSKNPEANAGKIATLLFPLPGVEKNITVGDIHVGDTVVFSAIGVEGGNSYTALRVIKDSAGQ